MHLHRTASLSCLWALYQVFLSLAEPCCQLPFTTNTDVCSRWSSRRCSTAQHSAPPNCPGTTHRSRADSGDIRQVEKVPFVPEFTSTLSTLAMCTITLLNTVQCWVTYGLPARLSLTSSVSASWIRNQTLWEKSRKTNLVLVFSQDSAWKLHVVRVTISHLGSRSTAGCKAGRKRGAALDVRDEKTSQGCVLPAQDGKAGNATERHAPQRL